MKRSIGAAMLAIALGVGALTGFATLAKAQTASASWPHYSIINLGTLGGLEGNGYGGPSNNGEWVSGDSALSNNVTEHAALWRRDAMGQFVVTDLGTLGGGRTAAWVSLKRTTLACSWATPKVPSSIR